ncbi:hypothetical protein [Clostridium sp. AM58-1XD]|uniref:hypothetical protein n=1 Tax=Clostridium sp. AM58-1XD TaxID=2292307 RepID=UPI000E52E2D2|nr:hypothetical protein [Clostridium sp. AM58-1XD]RGY98697.1 hypothetical protein DXA13_10095 [Clostridium sp. AM58-1XD]
MKKLILCGMAACMLIGCGNGGSKTAAEKTEVSSTQETESEAAQETESTEAEKTETETMNPLESRVAWAEEEAKKAAANAEAVTEGDLFDRVSQIHKDVTITKFPDYYGVDVSINEGTPQECADQFLGIAEKIIKDAGNDYDIDIISLNYKNEIAILSLSKDVTGDYLSIEPVSLSEISDYVIQAYKTSEYFQKIDLTRHANESLKNIADKYPLEEGEEFSNGEILSGYKKTSFKQIEFQVPENWNEKTVNDNMKSYLDGAEGLFANCYEIENLEQKVTSKEIEKDVLEKLSEVILEDFNVTSSEYITILDDTTALKVKGSTEINGITVLSQTYMFLYSEKFCSFMFLSPSDLDTAAISNVINSIN